MLPLMRRLRVPQLHSKLWYSSKPWYLNQVVKKERPELDITLPNNPPANLKVMCEKLVNDYGLLNLEILDARAKESALGPAIMVVGTGKSVRHLGRATHEFKTWLKEQFGLNAFSEGTLTSNFIRTWRRRTKRRQERQRSYAPALEIDPTLQQKTGDWIVVDTKSENIYVHLLTQEKRDALELDTLFLKQEDEIEDEPSETFAQPRGTTFGGRRNYSTLSATVTKRTETLLTKAAETINGAPLAELTAFVQSQLIAGHPFQRQEITALLTAITYYRHADFETLHVDSTTSEMWREVCDEKSKAIVSICDLITRPRGQLLLDDTAISLLWRAYFTPSADSITPADAMKNPTPGQHPSAFADSRFKGLVDLLESFELYTRPQILVPLCCALINANSWNTFWRLVDKANVAVDLPDIVIDAIVAMVVKAGHEVHITQALTTFLPNCHRILHDVSPSPELKRAILSGLEIIDRNKKGFEGLRLLAT